MKETRHRHRSRHHRSRHHGNSSRRDRDRLDDDSNDDDKKDLNLFFDQNDLQQIMMEDNDNDDNNGNNNNDNNDHENNNNHNDINDAKNDDDDDDEEEEESRRKKRRNVRTHHDKKKKKKRMKTKITQSITEDDNDNDSRKDKVRTKNTNKKTSFVPSSSSSSGGGGLLSFQDEYDDPNNDNINNGAVDKNYIDEKNDKSMKNNVNKKVKKDKKDKRDKKKKIKKKSKQSKGGMGFGAFHSCDYDEEEENENDDSNNSFQHEGELNRGGRIGLSSFHLNNDNNNSDNNNTNINDDEDDEAQPRYGKNALASLVSAQKVYVEAKEENNEETNKETTKKMKEVVIIESKNMNEEDEQSKRDWNNDKKSATTTTNDGYNGDNNIGIISEDYISLSGPSGKSNGNSSSVRILTGDEAFIHEMEEEDRIGTMELSGGISGSNNVRSKLIDNDEIINNTNDDNEDGGNIKWEEEIERRAGITISNHDFNNNKNRTKVSPPISGAITPDDESNLPTITSATASATTIRLQSAIQSTLTLLIQKKTNIQSDINRRTAEHESFTNEISNSTLEYESIGRTFNYYQKLRENIIIPWVGATRHIHEMLDRVEDANEILMTDISEKRRKMWREWNEDVNILLKKGGWLLVLDDRGSDTKKQQHHVMYGGNDSSSHEYRNDHNDGYCGNIGSGSNAVDEFGRDIGSMRKLERTIRMERRNQIRMEGRYRRRRHRQQQHKQQRKERLPDKQEDNDCNDRNTSIQTGTNTNTNANTNTSTNTSTNANTIIHKNIDTILKRTMEEYNNLTDNNNTLISDSDQLKFDERHSNLIDAINNHVLNKHGHDPDGVDYNAYGSSACSVVLIDAFREWYDTKPKDYSGCYGDDSLGRLLVVHVRAGLRVGLDWMCTTTTTTTTTEKDHNEDEDDYSIKQNVDDDGFNDIFGWLHGLEKKNRPSSTQKNKDNDDINDNDNNNNNNDNNNNNNNDNNGKENEDQSVEERGEGKNVSNNVPTSSKSVIQKNNDYGTDGAIVFDYILCNAYAPELLSILGWNNENSDNNNDDNNGNGSNSDHNDDDRDPKWRYDPFSSRQSRKAALFYRNILTAVEKMKTGRSKMKMTHPSLLKEIRRAIVNRIVRRVNDDSDPSMVVTVRAVDKLYELLTTVAASLTNDNDDEWINNGKSDDNDDDRRLLDALLFATFGQLIRLAQLVSNVTKYWSPLLLPLLPNDDGTIVDAVDSGNSDLDSGNNDLARFVLVEVISQKILPIANVLLDDTHNFPHPAVAVEVRLIVSRVWNDVRDAKWLNRDDLMVYSSPLRAFAAMSRKTTSFFS